VFAEHQQCQVLAQTAADSSPVVASERALCSVTHAVNQGLSVSFVPTTSYDQLEANPQLIYSQQAESKPALAI